MGRIGNLVRPRRKRRRMKKKERASRSERKAEEYSDDPREEREKEGRSEREGERWCERTACSCWSRIVACAVQTLDPLGGDPRVQVCRSKFPHTNLRAQCAAGPKQPLPLWERFGPRASHDTLRLVVAQPVGSRLIKAVESPPATRIDSASKANASQTTRNPIRLKAQNSACKPSLTFVLQVNT